jgi:hypothetical protein
MPAKEYEMVSLSVRVPVATAAEINRLADSLGVRRSHFYAVILTAGFRLWATKLEGATTIPPVDVPMPASGGEVQTVE